MKTQHTPGPWQVNPDQETHIETANGIFIGETWANKRSVSLANSRLIAAAPEMLEELKRIAKLLSGEKCYSRTLVRILAVIAKADVTGGGQ